MLIDIISWFGSDDTGLSSETIAIAGAGGQKPKRGWSHPHDPSDFGRCARLLERIPGLREAAFTRLEQEGGPGWKKLTSRWDEIYACMEDEVGIDWSKAKKAPRTYALMKSMFL